MDLSQSVIMPREDFVELQEAAWSSLPQSFGDRAASMMQTTVVCTVLAGAVVASSWGVAKAMDWYDERSWKRKKTTTETPTSTP